VQAARLAATPQTLMARPIEGPRCPDLLVGLMVGPKTSAANRWVSMPAEYPQDQPRAMYGTLRLAGGPDELRRAWRKLGRGSAPTAGG
jgi:hypothetical protein